MFKNKHFNAILTKFLLVVTVMGMLLPSIAKISMVTAVVTALCLSLATYIVADLLILSWYGNRIAVLTDVMITIGLTYEIVMYMERQTVPLAGLLFIGLLIGCGEWFYHQRYLSRLLYGGKIKP
jgi:hypothetical protein